MYMYMYGLVACCRKVLTSLGAASWESGLSDITLETSRDACCQACVCVTVLCCSQTSSISNAAVGHSMQNQCPKHNPSAAKLKTVPI